MFENATARWSSYLAAVCVLLLPVIDGCGVARAPQTVSIPTETPAPSYSNIQEFQTTVVAQSGEDIAATCSYELYLPSPLVRQAAVLVIYERGDSELLYDDASIRDMALNLKVGIMFAYQCNAPSYGDIQTDAFKGPGRTLFQALNQFAQASAHTELAASDVLLYGFSAAGVLATTTTNYRPDRVIGVVAYAAASANQQENTVVAGAQTLAVPFLLMANAQDVLAGTARDEIFYKAGWAAGARWSFAVQQGVGHCCTLSTRALVVPWIEAVVGLRMTSAGALQPVDRAAGEAASFECSLNGTEDVTGYEDCGFTAAALNDSVVPKGSASTWMPDKNSGAEWLQWVGQAP